MIARNYRFSVNSQAGVNVTVVIKARFWKWATDGSLTYSSEVEVYNESAIVSSTTAWTNDTAYSNDTDKWVGAHLTITITPASSVTNSATTNVSVQMQNSTDGGTTWPGAGNGQHCTTINLPTGSGASVWNAEIEA